ncbi:MAG: hypothetical protein HC829_06345, partial [Bacteroidales bacterium]|nr:hypothetical protein [Bacteroidales bacterium]
MAEAPFRAPASAANQGVERPSRSSQAFGSYGHAKSEFESYGNHAGSEPAMPEPVVAPAYVQPPAARAAAAEGPYRREDPYRRHDDVAEYDRDYGAEEPAYEPYYSEDGHMPPHGEGLDGLPQRNRSRLILMLMGGVIGLAAVGTGAVFGYRALIGGGEPPTIKAEAGPNKVAPAAPQDSNGQKLIYDRVGAPGAGTEKLVPREEQPVEIGRPGQPRVVLPGAVDP